MELVQLVYEVVTKMLTGDDGLNVKFNNQTDTMEDRRLKQTK